MTIDTSGTAIQAAMADPDPVRVLRLLGALAAENADLRAECGALQAERDVACNRHLAAEVERAAARAERDEERKMRLHAEGVAENNRLDVLRMAAERDALEEASFQQSHDFHKLYAQAEAERDAARAEVARLREALEEIERGHIPSMPMTEVVDELTWAQMWVGRLRKIARAALAGDPQP